MLFGIPSFRARECWHVAEPMLQTVIDRFDPGYTTTDILFRVEHQDMQLWFVAIDEICATIITEVTVFPQYKTLHAPFIAGSRMDEWFDSAFDTLEAFARANGCKYLTGCGRRGWARQGKPRGYDDVYTIVRKEL